MHLLRFSFPIIWKGKLLYSLFVILCLQFPQVLFAEEPCMTVQAVSYVWSCPGGGQGYFSITTDGCHVLVKYESCSGRYREFLFGILSTYNPNTGNGNLNELLGFVHNESEQLQTKKGRTNSDIKIFLNNTIVKVQKGKYLDEIEKINEGIKGKISINYANQDEISAFEQLKDKEAKRDEKKDVKKDDK